MKKSLFTKGHVWAFLLGIFCMTAILPVPDLFGVPIPAVDTEGRPVDIKEELKKDPDLYIQDMKTYLRQGNLVRMGFLARHMVRIRPYDPDVWGLYGIFLASKGDVAKARQQLQPAVIGKKENRYTLYAQAMILRLEHEFDAAVRICKKAISMDKSHPYPWNVLGRIYFDQERYREARASFQKATDLGPEFIPAYTNLGAVCFVLGKQNESVEYFQKAINLNPDSHAAHYGLAAVYKDMGNHVLAIEELKKSLESKPDYPVALQELGELQLKVGLYKDALATGEKMEGQGMAGAYEILGDAALHMGNTKKAINYLEKASADSPAANYLMGFCHMAEGQHKRALERMETVLQKNPRHFGAYTARSALKFYLGEGIELEEELKNQWGESLDKLVDFQAGNITASQGNWADAIKRWRSAQGIIQGFSIEGIDAATFSGSLKKEEFRYLNLGVIYFFKNLHENALSEFKKALEVNPDSILTNYWAAQCYLAEGDRVEAIKMLENATKKAPNFFTALYAIGELNFLMGNKDDALRYYQRALSVKKDAGILIKVGLIFERSKEYEKAEKQYEAVTALYPHLFVGYNQLAWLYAKRGVELEKALTLANKANELQPGNASILDTMGWIYYHKKDYDRALANVIQANEIRPDNPNILYHLGTIYHATGNMPAAKKNLGKALTLSKDPEWADQARTLLNQ